MRRFVAVSAFAFVFGFAGLCGGGGAKPEATPVSDDIFRLAAAAAADDAHLRLGDMPAGWTSTPWEPDDDDDELPPGFEVPPGCEAMMSEEEFPGSIFESVSDEYDEDEDEDVSTTVAIYRSGTAADMGQGVYDHFYENCTQDFARLFEAFLIAEEGFSGVSVEISELRHPDLGDWSDARRIEMDFEYQGVNIEFVYDLVAVRFGRTFGIVSWGVTDNIDDDLTDEWVELFADRLATADKSLPE
jgi:hypothetical protein